MPKKPVLSDGHQLRLIEGGTQYFARLAGAMDRARSQIQLETYIFDLRGEAEQVALALERAGMRGLRVQVVIDGVGSQGQPPAHWVARFAAAGVQCCVYSPLGKLGLLIPSRWRRLHRKLCVIDGLMAFCGGINVLDDHIDPHHGALPAARLDYAVEVHGPLVQQVQETMTQLWWRLQAVRNIRQHNFPEAFSSIQTAGLHWPWLHAPKAGPGLVQARAGLLLRDNVRHRKQIERAYLRALGAARHEIWIANAYFLPGRRMRKALIMAAKRGVTVRLLLQGRYEYFMAWHASRAVYGQLLAHGIEIFEYTASFLHAKVAVVDADAGNSWATVGSSNLDPLSLLLAREANVVVLDAPFAQELRNSLQSAVERGAQRLSVEGYQARTWRQRLGERLALGLMRLALLLTGKSY
jgi:cardiolipin synthase A/B